MPGEKNGTDTIFLSRQNGPLSQQKNGVCPYFFPALAAFIALALTGCAGTPKQRVDAEAKLDYLLLSAEDEAADGPVDCKRYVTVLQNRLKDSPYRYGTQRLYFCSLGNLCHVALKVDTGEDSYVADNGTFIHGNVTTLAHFRKKLAKSTGWKQVDPIDAQVLILGEQNGL